VTESASHVLTQTSVGSRIRYLRELKGFTQQELALKTGIGVAQTISLIELDERDIKAWELAKIARVLRTSLDVLLGVSEERETHVLWRRRVEAPNRKIEGLLLQRSRHYAQVEKWCCSNSTERLPDYPLDPRSSSRSDVRKLATELGRLLDLGSCPAASLRPVLEERYAVKLFFTEIGDGESAACTRSAEFGSAVLLNRSEAPWRRNFSLAHELFHLVTWSATRRVLFSGDEDGSHWFESVENLADRFAAYLLLPSESFLSRFESRVKVGKIGFADLVELAREFRVSTSAFLWRLVDFARLDARTVQEILKNPRFLAEDRASMQEHWRNDEEVTELPERFERLAFLAFRKGHISRARLATYLERPLDSISAVMAEDEDVVETSPTPA
jgi:Zn-dependent peptidase ImmA (M78 family)/transcriptional regulator with XRE-family HTH domain